MNTHHMLLLIEAVQLSTKTKSDPPSVRAAFNEAIIAAGRSGFLHHKGLACQLAGHYFASQETSTAMVSENSFTKDVAAEYFTEAINTYTEWEAFGIIKELRLKREDILDNSTSSNIEIDSNSKDVARGSYLGKGRMGNISKQQAMGRSALDDSATALERERLASPN